MKDSISSKQTLLQDRGKLLEPVSKPFLTALQLRVVAEQTGKDSHNFVLSLKSGSWSLFL